MQILIHLYVLLLCALCVYGLQRGIRSPTSGMTRASCMLTIPLPVYIGYQIIVTLWAAANQSKLERVFI